MGNFLSSFFGNAPLPSAEGAHLPTDLPQNRGEGSGKLFWRRTDRIASEAHGQFIKILGISLLAALLWASFTKINKVTRGSGRIISQKHKQEVQHLEGGIITEILVREGDRVQVGQPLLRIENTFFRSELAQGNIELSAKKMRMLRLQAEAEGALEIDFPPLLRQTSPQAVENEKTLFTRRLSNLEEQLAVLTQQARQKEIELSEFRSRQPTLARERQILEERLVMLRKLAISGAVSNSELLDSDRMLQQVLSRLSDLAHDIPKTEASLDEMNKRKKQVISNFRAEAEKELNQTVTDVEKLRQNVSALQERIKRSDILASIAGTVNKLNVNTIGGVVRPGEALAEIVPADTSISVEMRLSPNDRGNVWPGEKAIIKISAYEYSIFGGLEAVVTDISSDALQDEKGTPYFRVRLEADASNFDKQKPVLPGMLADVDVLGERQSVLLSLLRPLQRMKDNALRE